MQARENIEIQDLQRYGEHLFTNPIGTEHMTMGSDCIHLVKSNASHQGFSCFTGVEIHQPDPDFLEQCVQLNPIGTLTGSHCFLKKATLCTAEQICNSEISPKLPQANVVSL